VDKAEIMVVDIMLLMRTQEVVEVVLLDMLEVPEDPVLLV
jgi:hypothetical protein